MNNSLALKKIEEILIEYASEPDEYDVHKCAAEIYDIATGRCFNCDTDLAVWKEMMHEEHDCGKYIDTTKLEVKQK